MLHLRSCCYFEKHSRREKEKLHINVRAAANYYKAIKNRQQDF
jgi:hypothetical protein